MLFIQWLFIPCAGIRCQSSDQFSDGIASQWLQKDHLTIFFQDSEDLSQGGLKIQMMQNACPKYDIKCIIWKFQMMGVHDLESMGAVLSCF